MEQQLNNFGMADYCLFCLECLSADASDIDHEILLKTFSIDIQEDDVEAKICHYCNERLISAANFKQSIEVNRDKFHELMKARNLPSGAEIKQEVYPEEYQMLETSHLKSTLPVLKSNHCSLCQSSGPLQFDKIHQSGDFNWFSCPKCGRFNFTQQRIQCQFCPGTFNGVDNLQIHLQASHITQFQCVICKMHFWSEQSRNFHGQLSHCTNCCVKNMRDARTISFAEHEKSCVNRTTRQVFLSVLSNESPPVNVIESAKGSHVNSIFRPPPVNSIVQPATHSQEPSNCSMCLNPTDKQRQPKKVSGVYCSCPRCGFTVPNIRVDEEIMSCDLCNNFDSSKLSLVRSHIAKVHKGSVKRTDNCSKCVWGFLSTEALERHKTVCGMLTKLRKPSELNKPAAATELSTAPKSNVISEQRWRMPRKTASKQIATPSNSIKVNIIVKKSVGIDKQRDRRQAFKPVDQGCGSSTSIMPDLEVDEDSDDNAKVYPKVQATKGEAAPAPPRKIRKISKIVNDTLEVLGNADPLNNVSDADLLDFPIKQDQRQSGRAIARVVSNGPSIEHEASSSLEIEQLASGEPEHVDLTENEFYCTCDSKSDKDLTCSKCKCRKKMNESSRMKVEKFICLLCDFKTFDSSEIRLHISEQHARVNVVFQCDICSQKMLSEELLKDHNSKAHSFQCKICTSSKIFLRKAALDEHMKKHQNIKPSVTDPKDLIEIN